MKRDALHAGAASHAPHAPHAGHAGHAGQDVGDPRGGARARAPGDVPRTGFVAGTLGGAPGGGGADALADSHAAIRVGSRSFAAAARLFPADVRDDIVSLYAWCRHCDDVVDGQVMGYGRAVDVAPDDRDAARERLAALRRETVEVLGGAPGASPPFVALARVLRRHPIPARWPLDHLDGFAMDVEGTRYATLDELLGYCWRVAGVVGTMTATIMGARDPRVLDRACDLGVAFQLTNIARDVVDDARAGRAYLPGEWLAAAGVPPDALADPAHRAALAAVAARLLDAAEPYYASARIGLRALPPRSAWAVATALSTYRAIGTRVRELGPRAWDARASTSGAAKLGHALAALPSALRVRRVPPGASPRSGLFTRPG
ncbi:MAG TPA: phytoene/squalene synthase family protein [Burkholderiaceae bacterium]|nr:phytoene/squalene synthase family protein [Burkholderiaceae bacterium]